MPTIKKADFMRNAGDELQPLMEFLSGSTDPDSKWMGYAFQQFSEIDQYDTFFIGMIERLVTKGIITQDCASRLLETTDELTFVFDL